MLTKKKKMKAKANISSFPLKLTLHIHHNLQDLTDKYHLQNAITSTDVAIPSLATQCSPLLVVPSLLVLLIDTDPNHLIK